MAHKIKLGFCNFAISTGKLNGKHALFIDPLLDEQRKIGDMVKSINDAYHQPMF